MAQQVYITYNEYSETTADIIGQHTFFNAKIKIGKDGLTSNDLLRMSKMCPTEYFYVIRGDGKVAVQFPEFDFYFKPPEWDSRFVHIWNNDTTVQLYNKEQVISQSENYGDRALVNGIVELKNTEENIYELLPTDIIFLSYDEESADYNYEKLKSRFPRAKRVHGVKGILAAHRAAANIASTDMFYVVDADAEISDTFNFDYKPVVFLSSAVHVWHSLNPINDLVYGYGGVKLFPTKALLDYSGSLIDLTTGVSKDLIVIPEISNITRFNTDPFVAWRSGFRECAKLASKLIPRHNNTETEERLAAWCTKGADREFGEFAVSGANAGMIFGRAHKDQPEHIGLINDYIWLRDQFNNTFPNIVQPLR